MPSFPYALLCALAELLLSICVGLPVARRLVSARPLALALAPIIGWAVFNTLALPVLSVSGFTRTRTALLCGFAVLGGLAAMLTGSSKSTTGRGIGVGVSAYGAAALLAAVPTMAVWPKGGAGGVVLSEAMFDHSKAAIIDDIVRLGLPPGNPFFAGAASRLVYYYLWHFSAAIPSALFGASGWEADAALTWFTAFASLALMMGLAASLAGRRRASFLVVLLSLAASLAPVLRLVLPSALLERVLFLDSWPQGWLFQASWAPQHLASASLVVVAVLIMSRLSSPRGWSLVPLLAVVAAAGFESSAWVGGVVFAAAALPIGVILLIMAGNRRARLNLLVKATVAAFLVGVISFPFLRDEYAANAARHAGPPVALHPFEVLGTIVPTGMRTALDLPAFWVILLVIQLPAIYFAGIWAMAGALGARGTAPAGKRLIVGLALLAGASFVVPWLVESTIANNDLGWRGVLPGILVLTTFAAAGLARWLATAPALAIAAAAFWALGIPGGLQIVRENAVGLPAPSAAIFSETPELWAAVRRHTAPDERVADNPLFLADSVRWPVNISWALLADRRSCYAGWNFARAFAPLPEAEIDRVNALFERVFAGDGTPDDIRHLATRFDCRAVVVTPSDGAWGRDPFAHNPYFHLVEEKADKWRIYRVVDGVRDRK
ncbi:MAG TPA: hypothetical protein VMS01_06565 [Stellaceae bacterium]|nr:hypothetical protein [Stellaceae bacterium]